MGWRRSHRDRQGSASAAAGGYKGPGGGKIGLRVTGTLNAFAGSLTVPPGSTECVCWPRPGIAAESAGTDSDKLRVDGAVVGGGVGCGGWSDRWALWGYTEEVVGRVRGV